MNHELKLLKDLFRYWYGALSITEIMTNKELIDQIKDIEKIFLSKGLYEA